MMHTAILISMIISSLSVYVAEQTVLSKSGLVTNAEEIFSLDVTMIAKLEHQLFKYYKSSGVCCTIRTTLMCVVLLEKLQRGQDFS